MLNLINSYLTNKETIKLTYLNSSFKNQRHKLKFNEQWCLWGTNLDTWYYDLLTNILLDITCISRKNLQKVCQKFPKHLTHLTFGYHFNDEIDFKIPLTVTHLTFEFSYNRNLYNKIPNFVIYLKLGYCYNQSIENCIPNSMKYLNLGVYFNQKLKIVFQDF